MSNTARRWTFTETGYSVAGGTLGAVASLVGVLSRRGNLVKRLGRGERLPDRLQPLWFHAASVGELATLRPLVAEVRRRRPDIPWGLTTTTTTGGEAAADQLPDALFRRLLPLDVWPATDRFLRAIHPGAALFVETELWPRLILSLARRGVPLGLASARLTDESVRKYRRVAGLFRQVVRAFDLIATRSDEDRERFLSLGAVAERTVVLGNTKLDGTTDTDPRLGPAGESLTRWAGGRPLVVWGCLRPGEDAVAMPVIRSLAGARNALWVLAPRHPAEFDRTAEIVRREGLVFARWSSIEDHPDEPIDVLVLDTLGELRAFYARADVAIVGGSFGDFGGHNVMEPALYGVPVLFGPDTSEWPEDAERLIATGGGARVGDSDELASRLATILDDPDGRRSMGERARSAAEAGRGASHRVVDALEAIGFFDRVGADSR